eukprot:COSAG06_NODE_19269_length_845_cov_10.316354_1_plen_160_part_10
MHAQGMRCPRRPCGGCTLLQLLVATVAAAGAPSDIRICSGLALFRLWVRLLVARVKAREGGELPIAPLPCRASLAARLPSMGGAVRLGRRLGVLVSWLAMILFTLPVISQSSDHETPWPIEQVSLGPQTWPERSVSFWYDCSGCSGTQPDWPSLLRKVKA